jgi:hypothetical protein
MASTYSDLKFELIGTGEQSGTWGNTTNTNLGTAIEEAITGSADVTFASGAVTLTLTNTNASQTARNLRLNLIGTSGGAQNLIVPTIEKFYLVNNACADAITVKNSTGTGIAVPAGKAMLLFNDGTNVVDALNYFSGTLVSSLATITGGTINNTTVGASTASSGAFTTLSATGVTTVQAGTVSLPAITTTGDTNTGIFFPAADTIAFTEGGAEAMRIDSSGNVGIGTSSPSQKLDVNGGIICSATTSQIQVGAGVGRFYADVGSVFASSITAVPFVFQTYETERMRIDPSGTLLVGCTSVPNVGVSGQYGTSSSSSEVVISKNTSGTTPALYIRTSGGASKTPIIFYNDTTPVGSITTTTSSTAYNISSDYRLKENVAPMSNSIDRLKQLKPSTWTWINGGNGEGFLAHEAQTVVPEAIHGTKDAVDDEGNPVYQGIDQSKLVPLLTAALQEAITKIEDLETRIQALENK